ncbi:MAG: heme ABC exporter ATP-binding protein CcmA [Paracoccaceae bacterium]|nr:heme ABC exporter ATP-binding protein CcmA [Paracoccaceae bacterium]
MLLSVSGLTIMRNGLPVLAHLSFDIWAGQVLFIDGRNGVGKTSLLRCLAGLQPAAAGKIMMAPDSAAYAGHTDGVKLQLTVLENLQFWIDVFGTSQIETALDAFDLTPLATRLAATLSAGQRRRLGLARMLLSNRPLWLFDEPTVSLDARSVKLFAGSVKAHLKAAGAVIIATHTDLGIPANRLDLEPYRADCTVPFAFDETFL